MKTRAHLVAGVVLLAAASIPACGGGVSTTPAPPPTVDASGDTADATSETEPTQDGAIDAKCEFNDYHSAYCCLGPTYVCGYISYCCCLPQAGPADHVACSNCDAGMSQGEECNAAYAGCCQGTCVKGSC
ncbi:MAG: hypothetical protein HY898_22975 [Deltaproteobacteria bacterium]|nr:hypothetical protein [Deltaproteobacteria bacterium]